MASTARPKRVATALTLLLVLWVHVASSQNCTLGPEPCLVESLRAGYGPGYARPVYDESMATRVDYVIKLHELIELSTVDGYISINAFLRQSWRDEFLQWDPSEHEDTKDIYLPISSIWQPDITLQSNLNTDFEVVKDTSAKVESDGSVLWLTPIFLVGSCNVDITYFPFDTQRCSMIFSSWSYSDDKIDLYAGESDDESRQNSYQENGIWDLVAVETSREVNEYAGAGNYSEITYTFVMKRISGYYILNIILPFVFVTLIANIIFILPPDGRNSKVTLSIYGYLAMFFFLQFASGVMPRTGETPIIAIYFLIMIVLVCLNMILMLAVYYAQSMNSPAPKWFRQVVLKYMAKPVFLYNSEIAGNASKPVTNYDKATEAERSADLGILVRDDEHTAPVLTTLADGVAVLRRKAEERFMEGVERRRWLHGSRVIDRWLLVISIVTWVVSTIVILLESSKDHSSTASN